MRRRLTVLLLVVMMPAMGSVVAPRSAGAWVRGGFGIVYGGPYAVVPPYPPPVSYPPAYYAAPVWPPPVYVAPPVAAWPSYGPDVAVRWNRYFTPDGPSVRGYTLPR